MEKVMEMYNKSKVQFVNVIAIGIGLFAVMFLSFISSPSQVIEYIGRVGGLSAKYGQISDFDWLVLILLFVAFAGNAYILYMKNMGKTNEKQSMMITLFTLLTGAVALFFIFFDVIVQDFAGASLDFGFFLYMAAMVVLLGMNGYHAFMNKDMAMSVMNGMQSDMKKKMDSQMAKSESMDKSKDMGSEDKM